jgi:hypothetical protein
MVSQLALLMQRDVLSLPMSMLMMCKKFLTPQNEDGDDAYNNHIYYTKIPYPQTESSHGPCNVHDKDFSLRNIIIAPLIHIHES